MAKFSKAKAEPEPKPVATVAKPKACPTCQGTGVHPGDPDAVLWCPQCGGKKEV